MTEFDAAAEVDPSVGPRTVWLASFPKSGNTWIRAIITALTGSEHFFQVNRLSSGAQPHHLLMTVQQFGIDPRWLDRDELRRLRHSSVCEIDKSAVPVPGGGPAGKGEMPGPVFRKTHEVYRVGEPGREPFPASHTRAAVLVVRDPRAVVSSWAAFFGVSHAEAAERISAEVPIKGSPALLHTEQPWGSWSSHLSSWLGADVPFPVHLVRYEDLVTDAVGSLLPVFATVGFEQSREDLAQAVRLAAFDRLAAAEQDGGFREAMVRTERFFRSGRVDGWRDELDPDLVLRIESENHEGMTRLGYHSSQMARPDPGPGRAVDPETGRSSSGSPTSRG